MKPRHFLVGFILIGALALLVWQWRRPTAPMTAPVPVAQQPAAAPAPAPEMKPPAAPVRVAENPAELAATARMYAAHAPLRVPEVADPDSATNKQILQTMVTKALAQPATAPATN
jgi:hypothetical protein